MAKHPCLVGLSAVYQTVGLTSVSPTLQKNQFQTVESVSSHKVPTTHTPKKSKTCSYD